MSSVHEAFFTLEAEYGSADVSATISKEISADVHPLGNKDIVIFERLRPGVVTKRLFQLVYEMLYLLSS